MKISAISSYTFASFSSSSSQLSLSLFDCVSVCVCLSLCVPLSVSLSLLALIYGVEEASSGLNNAHRFQLELLVSSSFLSVFLHQELSKAYSQRLSGLRHHSVSFLEPAGYWFFFLEASDRKLVTMIFFVLLASCNSFKPPCCRDGLVLFLSPPVGKLSLLFFGQMSSSS